ncbi:MAG: hypothetical protein HQM00_05725 [Magnetococcales bacterium]|nr:hypothetical protein [Magnetococcales bacterium]
MPVQESFIGEGIVYLGLVSGGLIRDVGQVSGIKLSISSDEKKLQNYRGGGGTADTASRIKEVVAEFEFRSFSPENLAIALRGEVSDLASGSVSDQGHTAFAGGFVPLTGVGPTTVTVTVDPSAWASTTAKVLGEIVKPGTGTHFYKVTTAGTTGGTEPTWPTNGTTVTDGTVVWTDMGTMALSSTEFETRSMGVYIPEDSTKIAVTGTSVKISYTKTAGYSLQTMVNSGLEYRVIFDGTNFAQADAPLTVDMYRVKFSATDDLSLIGDDFGTLKLKAEILSDSTKTGTGISKFFEMRMAA